MSYVLVVDDDQDFSEATAAVLRQEGHEVSIRSSVSGVLESMSRRLPDLVILDVMFPEDASAGFGLARAIRQHSEHLKNVPILMLTAVNARFPLNFSKRDIDEVWMPVTDFLEKPVDLKQLTQRVKVLLEGGAASP